MLQEWVQILLRVIRGPGRRKAKLTSPETFQMIHRILADRDQVIRARTHRHAA